MKDKKMELTTICNNKYACTDINQLLTICYTDCADNAVSRSAAKDINQIVNNVGCNRYNYCLSNYQRKIMSRRIAYIYNCYCRDYGSTPICNIHNAYYWCSLGFFDLMTLTDALHNNKLDEDKKEQVMQILSMQYIIDYTIVMDYLLRKSTLISGLYTDDKLKPDITQTVMMQVSDYLLHADYHKIYCTADYNSIYAGCKLRYNLRYDCQHAVLYLLRDYGYITVHNHNVKDVINTSDINDTTISNRNDHCKNYDNDLLTVDLIEDCRLIYNHLDNDIDRHVFVTILRNTFGNDLINQDIFKLDEDKKIATSTYYRHLGNIRNICRKHGLCQNM